MTIELYPKAVHEGDLTPKIPSGIDTICEAINAACKGFGTNEKALLKAMGGTTQEQRMFVGRRYQEMFNQDLEKVMKSECGNRSFGTALQYLALDPVSAECEMIMDASKGIGTKEMLVISILCGRTNKEIDILKKKFFDRYTKDLGSVLAGEFTGTMEKLVLTLLQANEETFDEGYHTKEKMIDDMEKLYKAGQGKLGTDEATIFKILAMSPADYLAKMNLEYADKYGTTLVRALDDELRGIAQDAALFMLGMKIKPFEQIAKLIEKACKGAGTNELLLSTALIRYQACMKDVMIAHVELFSQTIEDRVKKETNGDFEALLLALLQT